MKLIKIHDIFYNSDKILAVTTKDGGLTLHFENELEIVINGARICDIKHIVANSTVKENDFHELD